MPFSTVLPCSATLRILNVKDSIDVIPCNRISDNNELTIKKHTKKHYKQDERKYSRTRNWILIKRNKRFAISQFVPFFRVQQSHVRCMRTVHADRCISLHCVMVSGNVQCRAKFVPITVLCAQNQFGGTTRAASIIHSAMKSRCILKSIQFSVVVFFLRGAQLKRECSGLFFIACRGSAQLVFGVRAVSQMCGSWLFCDTA